VARLIAECLRGLGTVNVLGPIFAKELRIASRRRRNYFLRTLYVAILAVVVGLVWFSVMDIREIDPIRRAAKMSEAAIFLLISIGVFQFITLQIVAPVLTSTAISDEITNQTLGALMMTRINSVQIVVGKLFSKLMTMILLVCTTLPLLMIIRVFGGIEWRLVVELVALTLCAALFAATISLLFSIFHKRAYAAIVMTYITLLTIYAAVPLLITAAGNPNWMRWQPKYFSYFNPFFSLTQLVDGATSPRPWRGPSITEPFVQCALLVGATLVLVVLASLLVRRAALRLAAGQAVLQLGEKYRRRKHEVDEKRGESSTEGTDDVSESLSGQPSLRKRKSQRVRVVSDRPVLWKELRTPILPTRRQQTILICAIIIALMFTYVSGRQYLGYAGAHVFYTVIFMIIILFASAVLPAISITSEKEALTWEALLASPLDGRDVILGKAVGSICRVLPVAGILFAHVAIFTVMGVIHPIGLVHAFLLTAGPVVFLVGTGTYFSLRAKRTTTAVILNLGLAVFVWIALPVLAGLQGEIMRGTDDVVESILAFNPVVLNFGAFMETGAHGWRTMSSSSMGFHWPSGYKSGVGEFTAALMGVSLIYAFIGTVMLGLANLSFRRIAGRSA